jgi:hypothetical protein
MILRTKKRKQFTMISNTPIRDPHVSADALAFLVYLYSQPDDWRVTHQDLMRRFGYCRNKTYTVLGELQQSGYITRQMLRAPSGRVIGHEFIVSDEPQFDGYRIIPLPAKKCP